MLLGVLEHYANLSFPIYSRSTPSVTVPVDMLMLVCTVPLRFVSNVWSHVFRSYSMG